jgi:hypothetical protein
MAAQNLTAERLRELFYYDPITGIFIRLVTRSHLGRVGDVAGHNHSSNRTYICIESKDYLAHRLAWLYTFGKWPENNLDHINGISTDNRIANLRECNQSENLQNIKPHKDNKLGLLGVTYVKKENNFKARIMIQGKRIQVGTFQTAELAHAAYIKAKATLHTFQPTIRVNV